MLGFNYINVEFDEKFNPTQKAGMLPETLNTHSKYYQHYIRHSSYDKGNSWFVCGIDVAPPHYSIKNRLQDDKIINFCIKGSGTVNGKPFQSGQMFAIPSRHQNTMVVNNEDPWTICWISWRGETPSYFEHILENFEPMYIYNFKSPDKIFGIFDNFIHCDHSNANPLRLIHSFSNMIMAMVEETVPSNLKDGNVSYLGKKEYIQEYVTKAKNIISTEFATITISELSERVHLNRKYFSRIFSDVTGMTPQQYLTDFRLNYSEYYLLETSYPVEQVATCSGYSSYNSFVKAFRKKYQLSPREYKKKYRADVSSM